MSRPRVLLHSRDRRGRPGRVGSLQRTRPRREESAMVPSRSFGIPLGLTLGTLLTATSAAQQHPPRPWATGVVVPQARCYADGRASAVQIERVRAGVVVRGQVATTIVE